MPPCEPQGLLFFGAPSRANSGASRSHSAHGGRMRGWSGGMNGVGCRFCFAKTEQKQKQNTDKKREGVTMNLQELILKDVWHLPYFI